MSFEKFNQSFLIATYRDTAGALQTEFAFDQTPEAFTREIRTSYEGTGFEPGQIVVHQITEHQAVRCMAILFSLDDVGGDTMTGPWRALAGKLIVIGAKLGERFK